MSLRKKENSLTNWINIHMKPRAAFYRIVYVPVLGKKVYQYRKVAILLEWKWTQKEIVPNKLGQKESYSFPENDAQTDLQSQLRRRIFPLNYMHQHNIRTKMSTTKLFNLSDMN